VTSSHSNPAPANVHQRLNSTVQMHHHPGDFPVTSTHFSKKQSNPQLDNGHHHNPLQLKHLESRNQTAWKNFINHKPRPVNSHHNLFLPFYDLKSLAISPPIYPLPNPKTLVHLNHHKVQRLTKSLLHKNWEFKLERNYSCHPHYSLTTCP
jgi:hypothetical protein